MRTVRCFIFVVKRNNRKIGIKEKFFFYISSGTNEGILSPKKNYNAIGAISLLTSTYSNIHRTFVIFLSQQKKKEIVAKKKYFRYEKSQKEWKI